MEINNALSAIRRRSDEVLSQTVNPTITTPKQTRAAEIRGMLEFTEMLISSGTEVPAILVGGIHSEAERMKEEPQSEQQEDSNLDNALSLAIRIKNMTRAILATDGTAQEFPQDFRVGVLETVKEAAEMAEIYITLEKRERSKMTQVKELGREPQVSEQLAEQGARKNMEPLEVYFMMEKRSKEPANEDDEPKTSTEENIAIIHQGLGFLENALGIVRAEFRGTNHAGEAWADYLACMASDITGDMLTAIEGIMDGLGQPDIPFERIRFSGKVTLRNKGQQGGDGNERQ